MIGPSEIAQLEKAGTETERRLAACVRECWNRIATAELLSAELRGLLQDALEIELGEDDATTDERADAFVAKARALATNQTGKGAYLRWVRMATALGLAAEPAGHRNPREYYVELAREVLDLPAKDSAARGLAKFDLAKQIEQAATIVDPTLFDARYMEDADGEVGL